MVSMPPGDASVPTPGKWVDAAVLEIRDETARAKTFRLRLPQPSQHLAGQHYVVRLTAPDGYTASRSYSVASAPDGSDEIELTVEKLAGGEVSTFLHDGLEVGDELEVRGPIGGWFVWRGDTPAVLVGGGSGIVPLMAMLRLGRRIGRADDLRLLLSVRTPADLFYADELAGPEVSVVYSRQTPGGWSRPAGRLGIADLDGLANHGGGTSTAYVCGSARFADGASQLLMESGVTAERIRVERFGPTG
jgi:ferredoxin-NADP reductase